MTTVRILIVISECMLTVLHRRVGLVRASLSLWSARDGTLLRGLSAEPTLQLLQVTRRVRRW